MEDRHSISLELVFTVYDIDNTFKFLALQALQTEGERNRTVRFCSRHLPQCIAVILHLLLFYNTNVHVWGCYMYNVSNNVHFKFISQLLTKYPWYSKTTKANLGHICLQVAG